MDIYVKQFKQLEGIRPIDHMISFYSLIGCTEVLEDLVESIASNQFQL